MATRLKTVHYAFPTTAAMVDNTLTTLTQITVYLPEAPSGGSAFKSVIATVNAQQTATAAGNVTTRSAQLRLGSAGYTAHTNSNLYTGSGEDIHQFHAVDMTSHFNTNWSGTSMTLDCQVRFDGTATSVAWTNVCCTVAITYEYDDTSSTQVKSVFIPLDMPVGALATTKPAALATIPNLSTELPESSKTFRNTHIIVQGNNSAAAATTDLTMTFQLDSTASQTTGIFEGGQATDYFLRYVWDCSGVLDTAASMSWYAWANATKFNHMQAYLVVTYEFDATASTDVFVSLMIPMEIVSPMGDNSSGYQRGSRELWIEEPATITTKQCAFYAFWDQANSISGLNMRIGTGSFVTYTNTAAVVAGSVACMIRNDSAFTLARGRNYLNADFYNSDTADLGFNLSGFWIINYTAGKPTQGYGAANHTVMWNLGAYFDGAANARRTITATSAAVPETSHFFTAIGTAYQYFTNTTGNAAGVSVLVERLDGEGDVAGIEWETAYTDIGYTDPETGLHMCWSQVRSLFKRWDGDPDTSRMDIEVARRWRTVLNNNALSFDKLDLYMTYHTITFDVSGTVSGYADADGAGLTVDLHRYGSGERVLSTTTTTGGAFAFVWYDDTEQVFVKCLEDATHTGVSPPGYAA